MTQTGEQGFGFVLGRFSSCNILNGSSVRDTILKNVGLLLTHYYIYLHNTNTPSLFISLLTRIMFQCSIMHYYLLLQSVPVLYRVSSELVPRILCLSWCKRNHRRTCLLFSPHPRWFPLVIWYVLYVPSRTKLDNESHWIDLIVLGFPWLDCLETVRSEFVSNVWPEKKSLSFVLVSFSTYPVLLVLNYIFCLPPTPKML